MSGEQSDAGHAPADEQLLDPFGFWRAVTSRITGLGGDAPGHDPSYAFHTPYVPVSRGPARFTIRFDGLRARRGTLVLRIHMLADEPGAAARLVTSERIQLNRLVQLGGETRIEFEGFRGFSFAVLGQVPDDSDASAVALTVTLDRPLGHAADDAAVDDIRGTRFRSDTLRPVAQLLSVTPPTLVAPVSQPCTAGQLREPAWRDACRELGLPVAADPARWPAAYRLRVLRTYGVIAPGARGLLLTEEDAVAAVLRAAGCDVRCASDDAGLADEAPFDFLCSDFALRSRADFATVAAAVEASLTRVRPGGLALHLLRLGGEHGRSVHALRRAEIERLALLLISRRHEVAQFAIGGTALADEDGNSAFGLIVRRAPSPL